MTRSGETGDGQVIVVVPDELPVLTSDLSRILLKVLRELSEVEVLEDPNERGLRDR